MKRVVPQTWLLRHVSFLSFFSLSFFLKNKSNEMTGSSYWTGAWDRSALSVCVGDPDDWEVKRKGLSPPRPTWLYFFVNKIIINKRPCAFSPSMQLSRKKWIGLLRGPLFFPSKMPRRSFRFKDPDVWKILFTTLLSTYNKQYDDQKTSSSGQWEKM